MLAVAVWFVRSIPRTLSALAIASLIALALNPLVERLQAPHRLAPAHGRGDRARHVRDLHGGRDRADHRADDPRGPRLQQADPEDGQGPRPAARSSARACARRTRRRRCRSGSTTLPKRLSANSKPIENAAGAIADGVAAALFTILLAITLLLDGEHIVNGIRRLIPARRRADADRLGRLVYNVIGRYIAGTLFVAALAGVVMLTGSLALGVPLAPLIAVWVAITNPIPQVGGFLGGVGVRAARADAGRGRRRRVPRRSSSCTSSSRTTCCSR